MSCLIQIKSLRTQFSVNERKIADFILENAQLMRDYSSQQLAYTVGVSQSSIVKFSQKLGYKGFPDLKFAISESIVQNRSLNIEHNEDFAQDDLPEVVFQKLQHKIQTILTATLENNDPETFTKASQILDKAKRVQVVNLNAFAGAASSTVEKLKALGKQVELSNTVVIHGLPLFLELKKSDALVVFCQLGNSARTLALCRMARARGIKIIMLTRTGQTQALSASDAVLYSVFTDDFSDVLDVFNHYSQQLVVDQLLMMLLREGDKYQQLLNDKKSLLHELEQQQKLD